MMDPLEYVLNRMEHAAQSDEPGKNGYGTARRGLLDGIVSLRAELAKKTAECTAFFNDGVKIHVELATLREKAGDVEGLEDVLRRFMSIDSGAESAIARDLSAYLLEGETIISPVQRRAGDVEGIAKVLIDSMISGGDSTKAAIRLSAYLLEGK